MQCNYGLAGTGTTLNHQQPRHRRPNNLVLFSLNRGDDVAETTRARRLERSDQCTFASDCHITIAVWVG